MSWTFDHLNLQVSGEATLSRFFTGVMGWQPGYRPAFPFPGTWLYQDEQAVLHLLPGPGDQPDVQLAHIAFRTEQGAAQVLGSVRASGLPFQVRAHPEKPVAQIFVGLPGGLVFELEAPLDGELPALQAFDADPRLMLGTRGKP
ncbi:VOC family protein [Chitinimonas naiadis]